MAPCSDAGSSGSRSSAGSMGVTVTRRRALRRSSTMLLRAMVNTQARKPVSSPSKRSMPRKIRRSTSLTDPAGSEAPWLRK